MATDSLIAYVALAATVALTPGPNLALVIRTVLESGATGGIRATLGVASGLVMWALSSALGVAAVVSASPQAFTLLQGAGGVWLVFIGVRGLRAAATLGLDPDSGTPTRHNFSDGLITILLNPMAGAFYLAALPGFVSPGPKAAVSSLMLAALHIAMVVTWLCLCSVLVARGSFLLARPTVQQLVRRASALLLIGFGVRILAALFVTPPG